VATAQPDNGTRDDARQERHQKQAKDKENVTTWTDCKDRSKKGGAGARLIGRNERALRTGWRLAKTDGKHDDGGMGDDGVEVRERSTPAAPSACDGAQDKHNIIFLVATGSTYV